MRATGWAARRGVITAGTLLASVVLLLAAAPAANAAFRVDRVTGKEHARRPPRHQVYRPRVEAPKAYHRAKARARRAYRRWRVRHLHHRAHRHRAHRHRRHRQRRARAAVEPQSAVSDSLNQPGLDATIDSRDVTPPDTTGAIGPDDYVEFINSEIAVYSRSTLASPPVAQLAAANFVGDSGADVCDTQIQWDQEGQRWLYAALRCPTKDQPNTGSQAFYFGWSKTTSPTPLSSNWCQYTQPTGHSLEDFPKLGHDDSQIIVGTNAFDDRGQQPYTGSHIWVADKPALNQTTCPASDTATSFDTASSDFTPVPANIADSSADGYVVATRNSTHLALYKVSPTATPVGSPTSVSVPSYSQPAQVPQPGTTDRIDSSDTRLTQAVAIIDPGTNTEGIWTQHTIAGPGGGPSVVRWYELQPGATSPLQTGNVSGPGQTFAFNGAISPAHDGDDAALFYNSGDGSHLVDLRAQDRHAATPQGQMVEDLQLATSGFAVQDFGCSPEPCRWGDYAGASPDPTTLNSALVWGTGELTTLAPDRAGDAQWGTQNFAIDASSTGTTEHTLNVSKTGSGSGTVTSSPQGIVCGSTCSWPFNAGTTVTLAAAPSPGSRFTGWSGAGCSGTGSCTVTMDADRSVTATFTAHRVTVSKSGSGSGTVTSTPPGIACGATCSATFAAGTSVTLEAAPGRHSAFAGWSGGGCSGQGACAVAVNGDQTVNAKFSGRPNTRIKKARINSAKRRATFKFKAVGDASRFRCALQRAHHRKARFARCSSPRRYRHLRPGSYTFKVRAVGPAGADPSPAHKRFKIRS